MKLNKYCTVNIHVKNPSQYAYPLWAVYAPCKDVNAESRSEYVGTLTMKQIINDAQEYVCTGGTRHITLDIYPRKTDAHKDRYKLVFDKYKMLVMTERSNDLVACINISTCKFEYFNEQYASSKHYIYSIVFYKSIVDGSTHLTRRALDALPGLER